MDICIHLLRKRKILCYLIAPFLIPNDAACLPKSCPLSLELIQVFVFTVGGDNLL